MSASGTAAGRGATNPMSRHGGPRRRHDAARTLRYEPLEDRRVLAVDLTLLADFNAGMFLQALDPRSITEMNGVAYFSAVTPEHGRELWRSDGTAEGTYMVKDMRPGTQSSIDENRGVSEFINVNGMLYFLADDGRLSDAPTIPDRPRVYELWRSDGTAEGTVRLASLPPKSPANTPFDLTDVGGTLMFGYANELWRYDAAADAAALVETFHSLSRLTAVNGSLYFNASDGVHGNELWKSDGTTPGTILLHDIHPSGSSFPENLQNIAGTLYFEAIGTGWKTDGTPGGLEPAPKTPRDVAMLNGVGYYVSADKLFRLDGAIVADVGHGPSPGGSQLTVVGNSLYFFSDDGEPGLELWRSDGTPTGTYRVKDFGPQSADSRRVAELREVDGELYLVASDGAGVGLWKSDGTEAGTVRVVQGLTTPASSNPTDFVRLGEAVYFFTTEPDQDRFRTILWRTEGTTAVKLDEIAADSPARLLTSLGDILLFVVDNQLWRSSGVPGGAALLQEIPQLSWTEEIKVVSGDAYFVARGRLWRTNGTEAGTVIVRDFGSTAFIGDLTDVGGVLYFRGNSPGAIGAALWSSDGTYEGTKPVTDSITRAGFSVLQIPVHLHEVVNDDLYFIAVTDDNGVEYWRWDPATQTGTLVKDIGPGSLSGMFFFGPGTRSAANPEGPLYFTANDFSVGHELWRTDGTEGAVLIKDIWQGTESSTPLDLTMAGDLLYFTAVTPGHGRELWRSDGTPQGTFMVRDILPGAGSSEPRNLRNINGTLYFTAATEETGDELWQTDGTPAGTLLVNDLWPGPGGSGAEAVAQIDGKLLVVGASPQHGRELWVGDLNAPPREGDFDGNGAVDGADLLLWQRTLNTSQPAGSGADGNGDGVVDQADLQLWTAAMNEQAATQRVRPAYRPAIGHPTPSVVAADAEFSLPNDTVLASDLFDRPHSNAHADSTQPPTLSGEPAARRRLYRPATALPLPSATESGASGLEYEATRLTAIDELFDAWPQLDTTLVGT